MPGANQRLASLASQVQGYPQRNAVAATASAAYKVKNAKVLQQIGAVKVVPVIALDRAEDAVPLANALKAGGITIMEVTFRTAAAEAALLALKKAAIPGMCIGAGTVLTVEQAKAAIAAGSEFVISPGVNPEVVSYCVNHDVPVFPGIATPTDIQAAMNLGVDTLKFFPAESNGGVSTLSALAAVFSMVTFMPTGGITAKNISDYLKLPAVVACGGTWMVKPDMIAAGDFKTITALSAEAVKAAAGS